MICFLDVLSCSVAHCENTVLMIEAADVSASSYQWTDGKKSAWSQIIQMPLMQGHWTFLKST